jgi:RHS repeat-associated protein
VVTIGQDPILPLTRSAASTPFTDFEATSISRLSLTRSYNSADYEVIHQRSGGPFGAGWHHEWEADLSCAGSTCVVRLGALPSLQFTATGQHASNDGQEIVTVYHASGVWTHHNVLVRRPSGEWILHLSDGRELQFEAVCDTCAGGSDPTCLPAESGGRLRLTRVADEKGNAISVSYDRRNGVLLALVDGLGHSLELRSAGTCSTQAHELQYDAAKVATYDVQQNALMSVTDADGRTLRSYGYQVVANTTRLSAIRNEAGAEVAHFSYDSGGYTVGLVDPETAVTVVYRPECRGLYSQQLSGVGCYLSGWTCETLVESTYHHRGRQGDTATTVSLVDGGSVVMAGQRDGSPTCYESVGGPLRAGPYTNVWGGAGPESGSEHYEWTSGDKLAGLSDSTGRAARISYDSLDRLIYREEYRGRVVSGQSREEWRAYGVTKAIAQGVVLDLDLVTSIATPSTVSPGAYAETVHDYDPSPTTDDPGGYSCGPATLPAGSVVCRTFRIGYVTAAGGPVPQREATFSTYDGHGRLVRTHGPVRLDSGSGGDVVPVEEREYWDDGAPAQRRGRLRAVRTYASPGAPPMVVSYDYDMFGVSRVTLPDGTSLTAIKDGRGRPTFVMAADRSGAVQGQTETRYYDGLEVRLRVLPGGSAERYGHDDRGRLNQIEHYSSDPEAGAAVLGWTENHQHDAAGNRFHSERRDGQGRAVWKQDRGFDAWHRVVWESHPTLAGSGKQWTYDVAGFLRSMSDEEGRRTVFTPDGVNRVQRVDRGGHDVSGAAIATTVATYGFSAGQDSLSAATDGTGRSTAYHYDDSGRLERLGSPNLSRGGDLFFGYDPRGNVLSRRDQGAAVAYAYDGLDRVVTVDAMNPRDASALHFTHRYDERGFAGRLTSIEEPDRTTSFTYDWAGRVILETTTEAGVSAPITTAYEYDPDGQLATVTYPSGLAVRYDRDPATGQVRAVRNATGGVYATDVARSPGGPLSAMTFGNGRTLQREFNARYEPLSVRSGPVSLTYTPTPAGDIGVVLDESEDPSGCARRVVRRLGYDHQDRLTSWADVADGSAGSCAPDSLPGGAATFTYVGGTDAIASSAGALGPVAYAYDLAGSVSAIGYTPAGGTTTAGVCLRHDALGRMVLFGRTSTAVNAGGTACTSDAEVTEALARFKYDSRNRRVARQKAGQWTYIVPDLAGRPLSELALLENGTLRNVRDYVWLDGQLLAQIEYAAADGSASVYYAHLDHLGTPRALTNASGQLVWATYQRPNGEVLEKAVPDPVSGSTVVTNLRLPGQYDERLFAAAGIGGMQGPYYNWNRWYLPSVGRYLELDPIAMAGGMNGAYTADWYGYASQNPLSFIDPLGLSPNDWWDPRFYWNTWRDVLGTGRDFWRNYRDMRDANTINADKYFHCMANCEGASRGWAGVQTAEDISETREWVDEHVKGDPRWACDQDRAANALGRRRQPPGSCQNVCAPLRPPGLPPRY